MCCRFQRKHTPDGDFFLRLEFTVRDRTVAHGGIDFCKFMRHTNLMHRQFYTLYCHYIVILMPIEGTYYN